MKDLTKPYVRTLVDATQGGVDRNIRLTIHPVRPSLADAARIMDRLIDPGASKWGGQSSHRQVGAPGPEHGLVSIMGPDGLFYANTVGAFGAASAGQNWDRLASAVHRWALKLTEAKEALILLFSDGTHFLAGNEIFGEPLLVITFLMILGYPFSEEKFWAKTT